MRLSVYLCSLFFILFILNACRSQPADPVPQHDSFTIQSAALGESRTMNVWLPENYMKDSSSLPVLYMLDGGVKEDFPHLANTIASLIAQGKIKPLILVGIENTQRRRDLTGETTVASDRKVAPVVGGSAVFRKFVSDELLPEVEKKYRTNSVRGIIGESLAGYFVIETFLFTPQLFDNYIAFDPSLWWNDHKLVANAKDYLNKFPDKNIKLWFAASDAKDVFKHTDKLAGTIKELNMPALQWNYSSEPKEQHNTIFRATKEKALIWMYKK